MTKFKQTTPDIEHRTFVTDAPIIDPKMDRFRRWPFAQRVARTIASRRDPGSIVIGVYGAWGDGKTSVLNFIQNELNNYEHVIVVRFNPWLFGTDTQMIQSFFHVLSDALGKSLTSYREKIGEWLEKYGSVFSATPWGIGEGLKDIGKALNATDIEEYRTRVETLLQDQQKRVVIFMDDIDRLDKSEIQTVFKLVKLTGDFAHTSYVLAFDEEMVAAALSEKYGAGGTEAGRHFLEKIVQVPLHLPVVDRETLRSYCFEGVDEALGLAGIELSAEQTEEYVYHFATGIQNRMHTPRMAKRYGNALTFALPILKDEVNPVDLMLIEGIRIFYPEIYEHIRANPDLYLGKRSYGMLGPKEDQEGQELLKQGLVGLSSSDRKCAELLLQSLFPSIKAFLKRSSNWPESSPRELKERRVSSASYFPRYFLYAVPDTDVSDAAVSSFLGELDTLGVDEVVNRLPMLVDGRRASRFVEKLRQFEEELSPQVSEVLAKAISRSGNLFPNEGATFSFLTPYVQSTILVARLLRNLPAESARLEAGMTVLREGQPLDYANDCFYMMISGKKDDGEEALYTKEEEKQMGLSVVARIKQLAERSVLIVSNEHPLLLLYTWAVWGSREETNQYLQRMFEKDESHVLHLIWHSLGRVRTLGSNITRLGEFRRENYDQLKHIVDVDAIFVALKKVYGDSLDDTATAYERSIDEPTDRLLAMQFAYVHQQVVNE